MTWERTFTQMKKDLGHWLGVDSSLTSQNYVRFPDDVRGMLINQTRLEIAMRRDLRFFESTDTITTADGDQDYGLPTDWLRPYSAHYVDDSDGLVTLPFITRAEYDELYADDDDSDEGSPENICVYGEHYLVGPVPDTVYSIYVRYFKKPPDLTGSNDDAFLTHAWDAIFFGAALRGCDYLMEDARRSLFSGRYTEALRHLSVDSSRSRWSARRLQSKITGA